MVLMNEMHDNIDTMKALLLATSISLLNIPVGFIPKVSLLVMMFLAMVFDFLTGIAKAYILKQAITSKALRRTVTKFSQYGGALLIGLAIAYMSTEVGEKNDSWIYAPKVVAWFNNGLLIFIITIECRSIIENLVAMDKNSAFAKNLLRPALRILNIQIKNNPVAKISIETDEDIEITQEKISSKSIEP